MAKAFSYVVTTMPRVSLDGAARLSIVATCAMALIFAGPALPF